MIEGPPGRLVNVVLDEGRVSEETGIATGKTPALIEPFKLERFYNDDLVSEVAAAAVSH